MDLINKDNSSFIRSLFDNGGTMIVFTPPLNGGNINILTYIGDTVVNEIPDLSERITEIHNNLQICKSKLAYIRLWKTTDEYKINFYSIFDDSEDEPETVNQTIDEYIATGYRVIDAKEFMPDISNAWDINESIQIDYAHLRDQSVIGLEFFNPEEYSNAGIIYTIIDSDDRGIDVQWNDNIDGHDDDDNYDTIYWDEFIKDLNRGFWKLKTELSDFNPFETLQESKYPQVKPELQWLMGKYIIFDDKSTPQDIKDVYKQLIDYGFEPWGKFHTLADDYDKRYGSCGEYIEEMVEYLQRWEHLYINTYSVEGVPKLSYGYDEDDYSLKTERDIISYRDVISLPEQDFFMNESHQIIDNYEPKEGDFLYCHTELVMDDSETVEATVGRSYEIIDISHQHMTIIDNSGDRHDFELRGEYKYRVWFDLIPKEHINDLDVDFFGDL